ncbi:hypothetical protein [Burkholderia sp. PAMC 26561]|uniref:hypothetical protein n=1 Tax=Burkholderia sp. PAMC 26561 TaxID=1795043 RepID=UPI000783702F|nr:hypothetical protein [Burkholderia sp. PAMC 26561]
MYNVSVLSSRDWIALINQPSLDSFAMRFSKDVALEASVLKTPIIGTQDIRRFFDATRRMYESIAFVHEACTDSHTYLAWEGIYAGHPVAGVTVLGRNASGVISHIGLHHRPFAQVVAFSAGLEAILSPS